MEPHAGVSPDRDQTTRDKRRRLLLKRRQVSVGLALTAVLPFLATSVLAQSTPPSQALEFDHEGGDVKGYVLYATRREDGVERRIDVGLPSKSDAGRFRVPLPPLEKGTWRIELAAYNNAGESPRAMADPPEVQIDSAANAQPATKSQAAAKGSPKPSPAAQKATPPKKKKGVMGRLWTFIVGDDKP